jgi:glycosyltransferase involved in cell wall biosynthesis
VQFPEKMNVQNTTLHLDIAIVYSRFPFPMMRGDQLTIAHLIEFLSARGHRVHLYTSVIDGQAGNEEMQWLSQRCESLNLLKNSMSSRIFNTLLSAVRFRPLQVGMFENKKLNKLVHTDLNEGKFDVVYNYYLRSASSLAHYFTPNNISIFKNRKTIGILALQLSQYLNTVRIAKNEKNILKRFIYTIECRLIRKYEANSWKHATKIALIGPKDVDAVNKACDEENVQRPQNIIYAAHGTNINKFRESKAEEVISGRIIFSGSMLYQPNIQAVLWFYENCWPIVKEKNPHATWFIVGRDPVREIRELHNCNDITVTGTVDDVSIYIRSAQVCINPVLAAGGMQNKLIEYFASNKAVVATSVANEGIKATPGIMFLEADTSEDFADKVCKIFKDGELGEKISRNARRFVEEKWTWESHFIELEKEFYRGLN